ncbi:Conserved hypothetical protein [Micromonospora lupini str. Lupac 08]|uniref:Uncharacterized protein n=1 Tax=Micromonospora lupini str. Lupac 08 TaxID=1150864 RepID=I0KYT4_9ACTN|nr:Conserved hypothetical protein [Micromonospora lupini str. Lupac 08]
MPSLPPGSPGSTASVSTTSPTSWVRSASSVCCSSAPAFSASCGPAAGHRRRSRLTGRARMSTPTTGAARSPTAACRGPEAVPPPASTAVRRPVAASTAPVPAGAVPLPPEVPSTAAAHAHRAVRVVATVPPVRAVAAVPLRPVAVCTAAPAAGAVRRVLAEEAVRRVAAAEAVRRVAAVDPATACTAAVASPAGVGPSRPGVAGRSRTTRANGRPAGGTAMRPPTRTSSIPGAAVATGATATDAVRAFFGRAARVSAVNHSPARRPVRFGGAPPRPGP